MGGDKVWTKPSMNFRPFAVGQIVGLVENLWKLAAAQGETIASVLTRSENGFSVKWVELQKQNHAKRTLCFCSSGEMTPSDRAGSAATYEYFDFSPFGSRSLPRRLRATRHGIPLIGAEIEERASESSPSAELFLPPAGAIEEPSCARSTEAEAVTKVPRIILRQPVSNAKKGVSQFSPLSKQMAACRMPQ